MREKNKKTKKQQNINISRQSMGFKQTIRQSWIKKNVILPAWTCFGHDLIFFSPVPSPEISVGQFVGRAEYSGLVSC